MASVARPSERGPSSAPAGASPIAILTVFACLACALGFVGWAGSVLSGFISEPRIDVDYAVEWSNTKGWNSSFKSDRIGRVAYQDNLHAYVRSTARDLDLMRIRAETRAEPDSDIPVDQWVGPRIQPEWGLKTYRILFKRSACGGSADHCTKIFLLDDESVLLQFPRNSLKLKGVPEAGAFGSAFDPNPEGIRELDRRRRDGR